MLNEKKNRIQAEKFVSSYRFKFNDLLHEKIGDHVSFFAIQQKKHLGDNKLTWNVKMVMKKVGDFRVLFFWFLMSGIESRYIMYRRSDCSDRFWITFRDNKFISAETFSCIVPVNLCCWQSVSMFAKYVRQKSAQVTNIQYQRV